MIKLFLIIIIVNTLQASNLRCQLGFAFLNNGNVTMDTLSQVYNTIFNELGTKLKISDYHKIIESGKPCEIPESIHLDSETLKSTLKEFSLLLTSTGFERHDVEKMFIKELLLRTQLQKKTEANQQELVNDHVPSRVLYGDKLLNFPDFTPDGKSLLTTNHYEGFWISKKFTKFKILNTGLNKGDKLNGNVYYSSNKQYVYYFKNEDPLNIYRAKIADDNGNLLKNWNEELWHKRLPRSAADGVYLYQLNFSESGKWMVSKLSNKTYVVSVDAPEKGVLLTIDTVLGTEGERIARFLPQQENLLVVDSLSIRQFNLKGEQIAPSRLLLWTSSADHIKYRERAFVFDEDKFVVDRNSKKAYSVHEKHGLLEIDLETGAVALLPVNVGSTMPDRATFKKNPDYVTVRLDSSGKFAFVLIGNVHMDYPVQSRILTYDIEKRQTVKETLLPSQRSTSMELNPDKSIALITNLDFKEVNLYRTEELLP